MYNSVVYGIVADHVKEKTKTTVKPEVVLSVVQHSIEFEMDLNSVELASLIDAMYRAMQEEDQTL